MGRKRVERARTRTPAASRRLLLIPLTVVAFVLVLASVAWACVTFQGQFKVQTPGGVSQAFGTGFHPDSTVGGTVPGGVANIEYCRPAKHGAEGQQMKANQIQVSFRPYAGCHWVDPTETESQTNGAMADEGMYFVRVDTRETFCRLRDPDCPPGDLETPPEWSPRVAGWFRMSLDENGEPTGGAAHVNRGPQCFFPPNHPGFQDLVDSGDVVVLDGHLTVDAKGHGSGLFTIPENTFTEPTNAGSVCTREMRPAEGLGHPGPPHASQVPIMVL